MSGMCYTTYTFYDSSFCVQIESYVPTEKKSIEMEEHFLTKEESTLKKNRIVTISCHHIGVPNITCMNYPAL